MYVCVHGNHFNLLILFDLVLFYCSIFLFYFFILASHISTHVHFVVLNMYLTCNVLSHCSTLLFLNKIRAIYHKKMVKIFSASTVVSSIGIWEVYLEIWSDFTLFTAVGGSTLGFDNRTLLETEPNRCRRTDGKKWRCSHEVVPDHKYCGRHIHRGAKRTKVPSELVTVAAPPPLPLATPEKANDCINLDTKLSISIPSRPQQTSSNEGHCTSASSSDATTISDENNSIANASIPSLENMWIKARSVSKSDSETKYFGCLFGLLVCILWIVSYD